MRPVSAPAAGSARSRLERYLERIERANARVNAVITLDVERARRRADGIDAALAQGKHPGALAGAVVTIKDALETEGIRTTCGAPQWANHVPGANAAAVQKLIDAGCTVFGKTNVPIYAGDLQSYNILFGATGNPWDVSRTAGGSSGGAAAAVACGLTDFELGSDIGGSIRTPAHFCGIYGHKPSFGLVPFRGHIPPPPGAQAAPDLAAIGPLTRSAEELARVLRAIAGAEKAPPLALAGPRHQRLRDFRAAVWFEDAAFPLDDAVREVLEAAVEALGRAGVRLERVRPGPPLAEILDDYLRLLWPVTTAHLTPRALARVVESGAAHPPDSWHAKLARYAVAPHRDWLAVHERRERLRATLERFFRDHDVLLMPVNPVPAFPHDHSEDLMARTVLVNGAPRWYWEQLAWIALATMAYLPATVAPLGLSRGGLPVGLQIVGAAFEDLTTVEFAHGLQEVVGGFVAPPGFE